MTKKVLAFDFGASSGRAMLAEFDKENKKISMTEIHRFPNIPVVQNNTMYWDVLRLLSEMKQGILLAQKHGRIDAIGIDTWGVDFGMLDKDGQLIANPVHYRDRRTEGMPEEIYESIMAKDDIYSKTGTQSLRINTLYQLYYLYKYKKDIMSCVDKILLMPDLFAYFLTGKMRTEITEASTTNLLDPKTLEWDSELIDKLSINKDIFADFIRPGQIYGELSDEICSELECEKIPVVAVATHDTASAVVSAATDEHTAYISCGTWSLFGTEMPKPIITAESMKYGITNEIGYNGSVRFLKNIIGLWIVQQSKRHWEMSGEKLNYTILGDEARAAEPFKCYIDCDAPEFELGENLPDKIKKYCERTNQFIPQTRGETVRCIYQSLAMKYKSTIRMLEDVTGMSITRINMVGGGIQDKTLCRNTANATGCTVIAGPVEATVMGNIAVQLIALGEIKGLEEAREIIANSADYCIYEPEDTALWDTHYEEYLGILGK